MKDGNSAPRVDSGSDDTATSAAVHSQLADGPIPMTDSTTSPPGPVNMKALSPGVNASVDGELSFSDSGVQDSSFRLFSGFAVSSLPISKGVKFHVYGTSDAYVHRRRRAASVYAGLMHGVTRSRLSNMSVFQEALLTSSAAGLHQMIDYAFEVHGDDDTAVSAQNSDWPTGKWSIRASGSEFWAGDEEGGNQANEKANEDTLYEIKIFVDDDSKAWVEYWVTPGNTWQCVAGENSCSWNTENYTGCLRDGQGCTVHPTAGIVEYTPILRHTSGPFPEVDLKNVFFAVVFKHSQDAELFDIIAT